MVIFHIAIENDLVEIVDVSLKNMVDLKPVRYVSHFQRVPSTRTAAQHMSHVMGPS